MNTTATAKRFYQNTTMLGGSPSVPAAIELECVVVAQLTGTNGYVLRRAEGPVVPQGGLIIGVDGSSLMPYGTGVSTTGVPYPPGTRVRVVEAPIAADAGSVGRSGALQITGVCNESPAPNTSFYPVWKMDADGLDTSEYDNALFGYAVADKVDRLRGKPSDLAPGDWGVFGFMKNNIFVGGCRTSIEGSPYAGLHMYADDSTVVFNKGLKYVEDSPASRRAEILDVDGRSVDMEMLADDFIDAAGVSREAPTTPAIDETFTSPADTEVKLPATELPRWHEVNLRGGAVGGKILQRVGKRESDTLSPIVTDFTGNDGVFYKGSIHSLTFSRSFELPLLEYTRELDSTEPETPDDTGNSPDPASSLDFEGYASLYADLLYELMRVRFAERYWAKLRRRTKEWTALGPKEVAARMARAMTKDARLPKIEDSAPAYQDDLVPVTDPLVEDDLEMRLARLESYIHLSQTGSLVLSDSRGSEIRLEGGNITISPAVDVRLVPGRDMTVLAPRTLSITGGNRVELNADSGELDIHGNKNVVVSAEGVLTMESRDTSNVASADYDKRNAGGGGVIIRSATGTHVIGASVRLAVQGPTDREEDGVTPFGGGAIILDAGASPICLMGDSISEHADRDICIVSGDSGSGIVINPSGTTVAGDSFVACVGSALFGGEAEMRWISISTGGEVKPELSVYTVSHNDNNVSVGVKGSMAIRKNLGVESISAVNGVYKTLRAFTGREQESLYIPPKQRSVVTQNISIYAQLDNTNISVETHAAEAVDNWYTAYEDDPLLTADGVRRLGIYYPDAEGYMTDRSFWVTSRWQRMLRASGGDSWQPSAIQDEDGRTMLYFPGYEMWTDDSKGFVRTWTIGAEELDAPSSLQASWTINCTLNA